MHNFFDFCSSKFQSLGLVIFSGTVGQYAAKQAYSLDCNL